MKRLVFFALILFSFSGLKAQNRGSNIEIIHFHLKNRCATCIAIDEEAKTTLLVNFNEDYKSGKVKLVPLSIEDPANQKLIKEWKVTGQALFVVKGDKKIDLTTKAVLYARNNSEKYHQELIKAIKSLQ